MRLPLGSPPHEFGEGLDAKSSGAKRILSGRGRGLGRWSKTESWMISWSVHSGTSRAKSFPGPGSGRDASVLDLGHQPPGPVCVAARMGQEFAPPRPWACSLGLLPSFPAIEPVSQKWLENVRSALGASQSHIPKRFERSDLVKSAIPSGCVCQVVQIPSGHEGGFHEAAAGRRSRRCSFKRSMLR